VNDDDFVCEKHGEACPLRKRWTLRRVILESPFAGKTDADMLENIRYARACIRDCILRGDAPIASHLLFTQPGILRDGNQGERSLGMRAGFAWTAQAEAVVVYTERGVSPGMQSGIARAQKLGVPVEYRTLEHGPAEFETAMAIEEDRDLTPELLASLLLTVGLVIEVGELVNVLQSEHDLTAAAAWARATHKIAQGEDVEVPTAPSWLEPYLSPKEDAP